MGRVPRDSPAGRPRDHPGSTRLHDQLHRASGAGRPASRALCRDRRARACDSRYHCGFATFARSVHQVEPEIAWAKFKAMAEGARLALKQLEIVMIASCPLLL